MQAIKGQGIKVDAHGWPDEQAKLLIKAHPPIKVLEVSEVTCVVPQVQKMLEDNN